MKRALIVAIALSFLALPGVTFAADTWTDPFPGVRRLVRTTSGPNWRIHAVVVDLCAEGVSLRATKSGEKGRVTSSFGTLVGADVAVNGDFFSAGWVPSGMAAGDGEVWKNDNTARGWVGFGPGYAKISTPTSGVEQPGWVHDAVGGNIMVLENGSVTNDSGTFCTTRHPRTAAGFTQDGNTLILAVVDGRQSASVGMTCAELGNLMKDLGAHDALNLDGGGSSTMWVRGAGVVNNPSDGSQRTVSNHLGVLAKGTGEPEACTRHDGEFAARYLGLDDFYTGGSSAGVPDVLIGDEFQAQVDLKSLTPRRWRGTRVDYWFESPYLVATDYLIESDHPAYDQATWTVNSANDAPENPAKDAMGESGTLEMHAFTPNETKRITLDLVARQYSVGAADHPDVRVWLRHIDDIYGEQTGFFEEPTNGNRFGEIMRAYAQLDVLSPSEWQFDDEGPEGWTTCDDGETAISAGAMTVEDCVRSPAWTSVDAARYDQIVVELTEPSNTLAVGIGDELLEFEGLVAGDNVLDLSSAPGWTGTVAAFTVQGTASIDGMWFQSSADQSVTSAVEPFREIAPLAPGGVDDNPVPTDPGMDEDDDGPGSGADPDPSEEDQGGDDQPGQNGGMMDGETVTAAGGCCATSAPRHARGVWILVLALVTGVAARRRQPGA